MTSVTLATVAVSCASGPSSEALAGSRPPPTTTTTEPPPEGVTIVKITEGAFRPANVDLDVNETPVVHWRHDDIAERQYVIEARVRDDIVPFMSGTIAAGDIFEVDFSGLPPDIYRYFSFLGNQRIVGSIDTRPAQ